jgi:sugar phosphate permease
LEFIGLLIVAVLVPVGIFITRSAPADLGLKPDGAADAPGNPSTAEKGNASLPSIELRSAIRTANFWLILLGSVVVIGAVGTVIQHFILFMKDQGYSASNASRFSSALLLAGIPGRVLAGYVADRLQKKVVMAIFYCTLSASILLLHFVHYPAAIWAFVMVFGFSMGADYMLIPLVTAECFGTDSLAKLLAIIIIGYSLGQWGAPWIAGRIFDARHSYELAWNIIAIAGLLGGIAIFAVSPDRDRRAAQQSLHQ